MTTKQIAYGPLHIEGLEVMGLLKQEVAAGEKMLADNKARLAHFEEGMLALMSITDPATIPTNQAAA